MQTYEIVSRLKRISAEVAVGNRQSFEVIKEIDQLVKDIEESIAEESFYMQS